MINTQAEENTTNRRGPSSFSRLPEPDARHFPSDDYVAGQSTLFGPIIADAHSTNIAPWGFQIRLRCSAAQLSQRLLPGFQGKGVFSDAIGRDDPVAIPWSGVRSAELVMGSRGLYRHDYRAWEESPSLLRTQHLKSADRRHPASVVRQPCGIEPRLSG
jgi:hypothetical protein